MFDSRKISNPSSIDSNGYSIGSREKWPSSDEPEVQIKLRSKSTIVPVGYKEDSEGIELGDRSYSFSSGTEVKNVRVLSETQGNASPNMKVTRVRRHTWKDGVLGEWSSTGDLHSPDPPVQGPATSSLDDLLSEKKTKRSLPRTLSPLTAAFVATTTHPSGGGDTPYFIRIQKMNSPLLLPHSPYQVLRRMRTWLCAWRTLPLLERLHPHLLTERKKL